MTATVITESDMNERADFELTLSDRVARAAAVPRVHLQDDGSVILELDLFPLESKTALPTPNFRKAFFSRLRKRLSGGRSGQSVRYISRQP